MHNRQDKPNDYDGQLKSTTFLGTDLCSDFLKLELNSCQDGQPFGHNKLGAAMSVSLVTAVGYMSKWQYRMIMLIYYLQNYKNYQYYQLRWLSLLLQADISESCSDTQFRISNMKRWEFSGSFRCARHKHRLRTRPLRIGPSLRV